MQAFHGGDGGSVFPDRSGEGRRAEEDAGEEKNEDPALEPLQRATAG
ncbi:MAG: hypothetical protein JJT88_01240 [Gammaproteobacteria bacterium]|nr:hypothetical protein [Gammaproteobacteria bacterium]